MATLNIANDLKRLFFLIGHPVGSLYFTIDNTNPKNFYGGNCGTWTAWGSGKVPVGVNANDSDFNSVEKTGGNKSASAQFEMFGNGNNTRLYHDFNRQDFTSAYKSNTRMMVEGNYGENGTIVENQLYGIKVSNIDNPNLLMPPYITCYIWKRTA